MHGLGSADHRTQDPDAGFVQLIQRIPNNRQRDIVIPYDEQNSLCHLVQAQHIRGLAERRGIDDDILIVLCQFLDELKEGTIQMDRIALQYRGQQIQIAGQRDDSVLHSSFALIERVQRPTVIHVLQEHPAQSGVFQVQINQQDLLFQIGHLDGQIGRHGALALPFFRRGDVNTVAFSFAAAQPVAQDIGRRGKVLLNGGIHRRFPGEQIGLSLKVAMVVRDDAQQLGTEILLHDFGVHQGRPHEELTDDDGKTDSQTSQAGKDPYLGVVIAGRSKFSRRLINGIDGANHQCFRQHILRYRQNGVH